MAVTSPTEPDPRTAADDDEATDQGVSSTEPVEGGDDAAPEQPGSPQG